MKGFFSVVSFFDYHTTNDNTTKKAKESLCYNITLLLSHEVSLSHGDCSGSYGVLQLLISYQFFHMLVVIILKQLQRRLKNSKPFTPSERNTVGLRMPCVLLSLARLLQSVNRWHIVSSSRRHHLQRSEPTKAILLRSVGCKVRSVESTNLKGKSTSIYYAIHDGSFNS